MDRTISLRITRTRLAVSLGTLAVLLLGLVAGCSLNKVTQPFQDAPRTGVVNSQPADIIDMPDGFNNVATKCDHGNRLYISYHGDGSYGFGFAVPNDPSCSR